MKKKTLGPVIKRQREALGLTQRELALKFGVKPSHAAKWRADRKASGVGVFITSIDAPIGR